MLGVWRFERGSRSFLQAVSHWPEWHGRRMNPQAFEASVKDDLIIARMTRLIGETAELTADELKIIIYNKTDFNWAEKMAKKVNEKCKLFLQPEWSRADIATKQIIDFVKNNPNWEISLQVHKFMEIP